MNEEIFLTNSKNEMGENMDRLVKKQLEDIENDKNVLTQKYNIVYYIEKADSLRKKLDDLKGEKKFLLQHYDNYKGLINDREKKFYLEVK